MIHSLRHGVGPCSSSVSSTHPRSIGMPPVGTNEANTRKVRPARMSAFGGKGRRHADTRRPVVMR
jgi:hypothetical protein